MKISLEQVGKRFGAFWAVRELDFRLAELGVCGLLGVNGAGKSTTMQLLTACLHPDAGEVRWDGRAVDQVPASWAHRLGYLPEDTPLVSEASVLDYLRYMGRLSRLKGRVLEDRLRSVARLCELHSRLDSRIGHLSRGLRQRVGLAQALLHDPEVLVLDEPSAGLDPAQQRQWQDLLRELAGRRSVLLSSHQLAEVKATCRRVIVLDQGRLVADQALAETASRPVARAAIRFQTEGENPYALLEEAFSSGEVHLSQEDQTAAATYRLLVPPGARSEWLRRLLALGWTVLEVREATGAAPAEGGPDDWLEGFFGASPGEKPVS